MMPRLLLANGASPYFFSILQGRVRPLRLLRHKGSKPVCSIRPCTAKPRSGGGRQPALANSPPRHVGFTLHWQETAHGLLDGLVAGRAWNAEAAILCGGFSACWFGKNLLISVTVRIMLLSATQKNRCGSC